MSEQWRFISGLSHKDYQTLCGILCPYCAAGLPDTWRCDTPLRIVHHIQGAPESGQFDCQAIKVRVCRRSPEQAEEAA